MAFQNSAGCSAGKEEEEVGKGRGEQKKAEEEECGEGKRDLGKGAQDFACLCGKKEG